MTAPHVKICGVRTPDDARAAADAGASLVGLVLSPGSPRTVDRRQAEAIVEALDRGVEPVALLVGADPGHPALDWWRGRVQLHGAESEEDCAGIAARGFAVMRGFAFAPDAVRRWDACAAVSALVVDGPRGGGGRGFDHRALAAMMASLRAPVLLAGGLDADNVAGAIALVRPWGVDVSSGVERERGRKDHALIARFCRSAGVRPRRGPASGT